MSSDVAPPEDVKKLSRWQQLAPENRFALITLISLGSALFVAGRTAKILSKRIPKFSGQPTGAAQGLSPTAESHKHVGSHTKPTSDPQAALSIPQTVDHQEPKPLQDVYPQKPSVNVLARTPQTFWDNRSMLWVKDREEARSTEEKDMNFNPALDAGAAFLIATGILAGSVGLAIQILGKKWQLDGWEDWRMFVQSGQVGRLLVPEGWQDSASSWIPKLFRLPIDNSPETDPNIDPDQWDWKQTLDRECKQDMIRREEERQAWVAKRVSAGRQIW